MVFMEFIEGLARLAYVAYQKQHHSPPQQSGDADKSNRSQLASVDVVSFATYLETFLDYVCKAFPHRLKYMDYLSGDKTLGLDGFQSRC